MSSAQNKIFSFVIDTLEKLQISYMIGGSVAAIAYGEPRLTLDMDVVVELSIDQAKKLAKSFGSEYYVNLESMLEAIINKGSFNVIQSEEGVKVDFYVLGNDAFSQAEFKRKRKESFDESREAVFVTPEDIILKKLQWYKIGESGKHLEDIKGVLKISGSGLDMAYIEKWAKVLEVFDIWRKLKAD